MTPHRAAALCLALVWLGCATPSFERQPWIRVSTPNFTILSSASEARTEEVARALELFRAVAIAFTTARDFTPRVPTLVYLFGDTRSFRHFRPNSDVAGYFMSTSEANYVAVDASAVEDEPTLVINHEYVHFILNNQQGVSYPLWYNEGLAELLGTVRRVDEDVEIGRFPTMRVLSLRYRRWRPLGGILSACTTGGSALAREMFYAQSWILTHYLHAGHLQGHPNRYDQMLEYLALVDAGEAPATACERAFGMAPEALDAELREYARAGSFSAMYPPVSQFRVPEERSGSRLARDEISFLLADLALHLDGHAALAAELFERARADAPQNARALAGLARARAKLGVADLAGQRELLDRAVELAPHDAWVQRAYGNVLFERLRRGVRGDEAEGLVADARDHFRRSVELEPELPAGYAGLGMTYIPGEEPEPGILALRRALELGGWDNEVAFYLAQLEIRRGGDPAVARDLLERVINLAHGPEAAAAAARLLAELDAQEAERGRPRDEDPG